MKKTFTYRSAFLNRHVLISLAFCAIGGLGALLALSLYPGGHALAQAPVQDQSSIPNFAENVKVVQGTVVRITAATLGENGVLDRPEALTAALSPSGATNDIGLTLNVSPANPDQILATPTPPGSVVLLDTF